MKIDQNLRAAIRSFCQISRRSENWDTRRKNEDAAVAAFIASKPGLVKWKRKADRVHTLVAILRKKAGMLEETVENVVKSFGLQVCHDNRIRINDHERFAKSGGKIEVKTSRSADQIIAQLAAATPEEGAKILADLGIKWE